MRLLALLLVLLAIPTAVDAQEGTVRYDVTVKLDIELPPEVAARRDQLPSSRTFKRVLLFGESASLMKAAPREEEPADFERRGMRIRFRGNDATPSTWTTTRAPASSGATSSGAPS